MSIKSALTFRTIQNPDLLKEGISSKTIRTIANVCFKTAVGVSKEYRAIVDTGAPVSLLPLSVWKPIKWEPLSDKEFPLSGITSKGSKPLMAKIARVDVLFLSPNAVSSPLSIKAYLLPADHIPLLLGFEDILTVCALFCDYKNNTAFLEF